MIKNEEVCKEERREWAGEQSTKLLFLQLVESRESREGQQRRREGSKVVQVGE